MLVQGYRLPVSGVAFPVCALVLSCVATATCLLKFDLTSSFRKLALTPRLGWRPLFRAPWAAYAYIDQSTYHTDCPSPLPG